MEFDEIVVGSGLAALATVMGLDAGKRTLVLGGPASGSSEYYDRTRSVPCARLGLGGLGNYWHGVIPTSGLSDLAVDEDAFTRLFAHFYPGVDLGARLGAPWLFVPSQPIRPQAQWPRLMSQRPERLLLEHTTVESFSVEEQGVVVRTSAGERRGRRLWICAGALHTPALLDRSAGQRLSREFVSDHVICYLGQLDRATADIAAPTVNRTRHGIWFEAQLHTTTGAMCTLRPARFDFATLDRGIEQRAVFGLPMSSALGKIARRASPGLIVEALYNRWGLFAGASRYSVYAQITVPDAYALRTGPALLEARLDVIRAATDRVRAQPLWERLIPSRRPDIFIPGIHLHHSLDAQAVHRAGFNTAQAAVQIVDASAAGRLGPEHHSFKIMAAAFARAEALSRGG